MVYVRYDWLDDRDDSLCLCNLWRLRKGATCKETTRWLLGEKSSCLVIQLILSSQVRYKSKVEIKEGSKFAQLLGQRNRFSFSTDHIFYVFKSLRFHPNKFPRINSPPNKHWFHWCMWWYILSLSCFFETFLNHAFEFKGNCAHNNN